jgi:hypothetical protein
MPTTPQYGWDTPADTDYVTNGALSIRTLGDDIDATVYSIQTTLDAEKLDIAGGTMTSWLIVPNNTAAGRAIGITADSIENGILQFLDITAGAQNGSIRVNSNNFMQLNLTSNGNALAINNVGEIIRTHNGNDRPVPFAMETGIVSSLAANSDTTVSLTAGRFTQAPLVLVTPFSNSTPAVTFHVGTRTTSNFILFNTSGATRNFMWQAIQMRSSSATG